MVDAARQLKTFGEFDARAGRDDAALHARDAENAGTDQESAGQFAIEGKQYGRWMTFSKSAAGKESAFLCSTNLSVRRM